MTGSGGYENLISHTELRELFGLRFSCLSIPKLIEVKRAAGRPKDFEAIAELEAIWKELNQQFPQQED